jgi:hypothetical protein
MKIPFSKTVSFLLILVFLVGINACVPMSKESYLAKYDDFIEKTKSQHTNYSEADWAKSDLVFEKFNGIWFTKFDDEFTIKDHLQISKFKIEYNLLKLKSNSKDLFHALGFDDYEDLKKHLSHYLKNDMEQDVQAVIDQAKIMGDSAFIRVNNILKDLDSKK